MKETLLAIFLLLPLFTHAQLSDNFSDGNFTQNPTWVGDVNSFTVNAQGQLQSSGPAVTGTVLQLATPSQAAIGTSWEFWANLRLATSATNYADVFLMASSEDLRDANTSGYFVRIGNTQDEVSLYRKEAGRTAVKIIDGQDGTVGSTNNTVRVRVTRSLEHVWELLVDVTGTGQNYVSQGTVTDATIRRSAYFGVLVRYTSANRQQFRFDDIMVSDTEAPLLEEIQTINQQELTLRFNEPLNQASAEQTANYALNGSTRPIIAEQTAAGTVRLVFSHDFRTGSNTLRIGSLSDLYGNAPETPTEASFSFSPPAVLPGYNELLITEIMADESPAVGLPAQEYIELYNATTDKVLTLQGIRYADASTTATLPNVQLLPGEYAVVVPNNAVQHFTQHGKVIGISNFPSLNNSGELLQLRQPSGRLIYAVHYSNTWYRDNSKRNGGWSLEMIDITNACGGAENWIAAVNPRGGTPAQPNSVAASIPDNTPPVLLETAAIAPDRLLLRFNERLDSAQAAQVANYSLSPGKEVAQAVVQGPLFTTVELQLASPLQERQRYTLTATRIRDCAGNLSSQPLQATFALPSAPEPGDVVINEVLFNPRTSGSDFVELVNRSDKFIGLQGWRLGNTSGDSIANLRTLTTANYVLAPGQYVVLTSDPENIKANYPAAREETFLSMASLPSYPDAGGTVVVLQADTRIADRFDYSQSMHFGLIDNLNGVSLERIRLDGQTIAANFHSAASTAGYATPGYLNSQSRQETVEQKTFWIDPQVFSPDDDGFDDFTTINYSSLANGFMANIVIYDAQGREIRKLARNELLATNGFLRWDGVREDGTKAAVGYYILYIELFDLNGAKRVHKEKVVIGGRF